MGHNSTFQSHDPPLDSFHYTFYSYWQQTQWDAQVTSHSSNFYTQTASFILLSWPSISPPSQCLMPFFCALWQPSGRPPSFWMLPLSFYLAVPWGHYSPTPALTSGIYFLPHSQTTGLRGRVEVLLLLFTTPGPLPFLSSSIKTLEFWIIQNQTVPPTPPKSRKKWLPGTLSHSTTMVAMILGEFSVHTDELSYPPLLYPPP